MLERLEFRFVVALKFVAGEFRTTLTVLAFVEGPGKVKRIGIGCIIFIDHLIKANQIIV